jgi:hypothetical protein
MRRKTEESVKALIAFEQKPRIDSMAEAADIGMDPKIYRQLLIDAGHTKGYIDVMTEVYRDEYKEKQKQKQKQKSQAIK